MYDDHERKVFFREILEIQRSIEADLREILKRLPLPLSATKFSILFGKPQGEHMPLILPVGSQDTFYIFGTAPFLGALLGPGQTLSVVSADPNSVVLTPDATPKPVAAADATPGVPAGTPTILSGIVSSPANPAQPGVPITCTATVSNADGSVAETLTDTVTVSPTAATAIGDLFGTATPVTKSSIKRR